MSHGGDGAPLPAVPHFLSLAILTMCETFRCRDGCRERNIPYVISLPLNTAARDQTDFKH